MQQTPDDIQRVIAHPKPLVLPTCLTLNSSASSRSGSHINAVSLLRMARHKKTVLNTVAIRRVVKLIENIARE